MRPFLWYALRILQELLPIPIFSPIDISSPCSLTLFCFCVYAICKCMNFRGKRWLLGGEKNLCQLCIQQRINIPNTGSTQEAKSKRLMEVFLSEAPLGCWRAEVQHTLLTDHSLTAQIGPLKKVLHVLTNVWVCTLARAMVCLPMSENGLLESLFSFHYIGPRAGPQVTLLGIKGFLSLR